jgi:hypothetical protein
LTMASVVPMGCTKRNRACRKYQWDGVEIPRLTPLIPQLEGFINITPTLAIQLHYGIAPAGEKAGGSGKPACS